MSEATLTIGAEAGRVIYSEDELVEALLSLNALRSGDCAALCFVSLNALRSGDCAALCFDPTKYIRVVRHGAFWAVTTQRGGYFTRASFTAEMTTDFSDRTAKEAREARSFLKQIKMALGTVPERSLSTTRVITLFCEFHGGRRYSIPQLGA